jgi:hypothetical protein
VSVRDPVDGQVTDLEAGGVLHVPRVPPRRLRFTTELDAWQTNIDDLDVGAAPAEVTIALVSRSLLRINASDWSTAAPVPGFRATLITEQVVGCCPLRALAWQGPAPPETSSLLVQGIALTKGRFRVQAIAGTRNGETAWIDFVPGQEHIADLVLRDEALQRTKLRVEVANGIGEPIRDARVLIAVANYDAGSLGDVSVRSFSDAGEGMWPNFRGVDADEQPETQVSTTERDGGVELQVRAESALVAAVQATGHGAVVLPIAPLVSGRDHSVRIALPAESRVHGTVAWQRNDPALALYDSIEFVELRGTDVLRSNRLADDGGFAFEGLPAGDYTAVVIGLAKPAANGNREAVELTRRPVRLAAATTVELALEVGSAAGDTLVVGTIVGMPLAADWQWTVAHVPAAAPPGQAAGRVLVEGSGRFQVAGLASGAHRLIALGRAQDGRGIACLHTIATVPTGAGTVAVELGSLAPPLWIDSRRGDAGSRQLRCELVGVDAWQSFAAGQLPHLIVGDGVRSVLYGFGSGRLILADAQKRFEVALPSSAPILVD